MAASNHCCAHQHKVNRGLYKSHPSIKELALQLAKAMEDAKNAKERGRELHLRGVLESDVHLLFDDKDPTEHGRAGVFSDQC